MSKVLALGLQTSTTTSYDQTKTTLQGRVSSRTINDGNGLKTVLGPSPVVVADVFDDTAAAPTTIHCSTTNGRIFIGKGVAAGVWTISAYSLNASTGAEAWIGDLKLTMSNVGVYTIKGFSVDDTTSSSMKISWVATNTTVQQGGWYASYGVPIADFHTSSVLTYPVATLGSTTKTIYQIGDVATQAAHTVTVSDGMDLDGAGNFAYILNGAAATPKIFKFDNTSAPSAVPVSGYSIANGTIIITATLPALAGVVLLVNNVKLGTIGHTTNSGSQVLTWLTTTTIYNAKTSDITNGATSLPSLVQSNVSLSGDYLSPAAIALGQYFQAIDKFVMVISTTSSRIIIKQNINNDSNGKTFGVTDYIKTEVGGTITPSDFGGVTPICLTEMNGWAVLTNSAVSQRNFVALDLFSDESSTTSGQINTSIISPVVSGTITQGIIMGVYYELSKRSVKATVQYRTSSFATGPGGGFDATWTTIPKDGDLSALVNATQVQFRILFTMMGMETTNPPMINEAYFIYNDTTQISVNWEGSVDNTTGSGISPTRSAFRLIKAYATSVPTMYYRAIDDSGSVLVLANTVTNASNFEYSTNNGTSWNPLGTITNTILTTELRYNHSSPPGVAITSSLRES